MKAWTVRRRTESERWNTELVINMRGIPRRLSQAVVDDDRPIEVELEAQEDEEEEPQKLPEIRGEWEEGFVFKEGSLFPSMGTQMSLKD